MDGGFFYGGILFLRPKRNYILILHESMVLLLKLLRSDGLGCSPRLSRLLRLKIDIIWTKLGSWKVWGIMV